jgi:hypothetical protein
MKTLVAALAGALLLAGCGRPAPPFEPEATCHVEGLGPIYLERKDMGCARYECIGRDALQAVRAGGYSAQADARTPVYVHAVLKVQGHEGYYWPPFHGDDGQIELGQDGRMLAHELLHVWEFEHFGDLTDETHERWTKAMGALDSDAYNREVLCGGQP